MAFIILLAIASIVYLAMRAIFRNIPGFAVPLAHRPKLKRVELEKTEYIYAPDGVRYFKKCPFCGEDRTIVSGLPECPNFKLVGVHPIYQLDGRE